MAQLKDWKREGLRVGDVCWTVAPVLLVLADYLWVWHGCRNRSGQLTGKRRYIVKLLAYGLCSFLTEIWVCVSVLLYEFGLQAMKTERSIHKSVTYNFVYY